MKKYLPIMIDVQNKKCLVVGGGKVALRKVTTLLEYGARVVVVAPEIVQQLESLAEAGKIIVRKRTPRKTDLRGVTFIFAASNNRKVNIRLAEMANSAGIPVNVVDEPEYCTFIMPAICRRGMLQIAVSTTGGFPALAKKIRDKIAGIVEKDFAEFLEILAETRRQIINAGYDNRKKRAKIKHLADDKLYQIYKRHGKTHLKKVLRNLLEEQ